MKNLIFLSFVIIAVATVGCNKKTSGGGSSTGTIYKGVVRINMCGQIAIETLGPDYLGEATWSPASGGTTYHHIFSVQNGCQFGHHSTGDTISFTLRGTQVQNCAVCMAYVETPATKYAIQVIK